MKQQIPFVFGMLMGSATAKVVPGRVNVLTRVALSVCIDTSYVTYTCD